MQITDGHERVLERAPGRLDADHSIFIDACAAQEARAIVGVAFDQLQREAGFPPAVLDELEQQPAVVIQLGPMERVPRELRYPRAREIVALDGGTHPAK